MAEQRPLIDRIYETVLYANDLEAAADFYTEILGLKLLNQNELMLVFKIGKNYLLIFDPDQSSPSGRRVPSHGCTGQGHIAFTAQDSSELETWANRLSAKDVEIEAVVDWQDGKRGRSIYFRDPAGNSVEFTLNRLWSYLDEESEY